MSSANRQVGFPLVTLGMCCRPPVGGFSELGTTRQHGGNRRGSASMRRAPSSEYRTARREHDGDTDLKGVPRETRLRSQMVFMVFVVRSARVVQHAARNDNLCAPCSTTQDCGSAAMDPFALFRSRGTTAHLATLRACVLTTMGATNLFDRTITLLYKTLRSLFETNTGKGDRDAKVVHPSACAWIARGRGGQCPRELWSRPREHWHIVPGKT